MTNQTETSPSNPNNPSIKEQDPPFPYLEGQEEAEEDLSHSANRIKLGLALAAIGYLIFLLGARPSLFGLDRSPVVGFVQISVFLFGLAIISVGSYITLAALWPDGEKTIAAQIGSRLISTGYVICLFTGMADIFGLGSHPLPEVFFGPLQARGVTLGMITIAVGLLLMVRYKRQKSHQDTIEKSTEAENLRTRSVPQDDEGKFNISIISLFQ